MIDEGIRYTCDACKRETFIKPENMDEVLTKWRRGTEIGDLCPSCSRAWDGFKESFVQKMRMELK